MTTFIHESGKLSLMTWLKWWDNRRTHIVEAYRPLYNAPNVNLAEASHASMEHCGGCNLSLVDAAYHDISESLRLAQMLQGYGDGVVKAGSGPSASDQQAREYSQEKRRTESYIWQLDEVIADDVLPTGDPRPLENVTYSVNENASHRPSKGAKDQNDSRPTRTRVKGSKDFQKSLELAKVMHGKYKMERTILTSPINASFHLRSPDGTLYTIEISKVPKCDCPYSSVKKGTVCKHRIFILVEKCGVNLNSKLLWQTSFTNEEVRALIRAAREARPTASSSTPQRRTTQPQGSHSNLTAPHWILTRFRKQAGRAPSYLGCKKKMFQTGDVHIVVEGLYRLDSNKVVNRKFRFCANAFCIAVPPANSNLIAPPDSVVIDKSVEIQSDDIATIRRSGVNLISSKDC